MDLHLIPWRRVEGLYMNAADVYGGRRFRVRPVFLTKEELRKRSHFSDAEFEKNWDDLKKNKQVKSVLAKFVEGKIVQIHDTDHPEINRISS